MTLAELRALRASHIAAGKLIQQKETLTAEDRTAFDNAMLKADEVGLDIARVAKLDALESEDRSVTAPPRPGPGETVAVDNRTPEERKKALNIAIRNYLITGQIEKRDLGVAADGILIPTGVTDAVVAKKYAGSILDVVNHLKTATGEPVKVPFINDIANGFVLNSVAASTTDPSVAGITISIDDLRMNPILLENSLIQDSVFDLAKFISDACQSRYVRTMSSFVTLGNTSNVQALSSGVTATVTSSTTMVLKYADFVNLLVALDPAYAQDACWVMSNATLGAVLGILDGNNRPIFVPFNDGATSGFVGQILGYPVKINPYQPAIAVGAPQVQFGDFKQGYTLREVEPGIVLRRLNERYAELNKVGFVAFARVGGAVTDAGTHPIITMVGK
jgi:HK97 family phage major capsid protein